MSETPERLDALERRLRELEERVGAAPAKPNARCPLCHAPMRMTDERPNPTWSEFGVLDQTFSCTSPSCGHKRVVEYDPAKG